MAEIFQTSVVGVYSSNLADIQTQTRGTSALAAGYNSALQSVVPIVLIPLTGAFFDRFGMRMFFRMSNVEVRSDVSRLDRYALCHRLHPDGLHPGPPTGTDLVEFLCLVDLCDPHLSLYTGHGWRYCTFRHRGRYLESFCEFDSRSAETTPYLTIG